MTKDSQKTYSELYKRFKLNGLDSLELMEVYRLYCDRHFYCPEESVNSFALEAEKWLMKRISGSSEEELISFLNALPDTAELSYQEFFDFIMKSNRYKNLSNLTVEKIVDNDLIPLHALLAQQQFSGRFSEILKKRLLSIDDGITFWIAKHDRGDDYFLPIVSKYEISEMIEKYITSNVRNHAELNLLLNHKNSDKTYSIDPGLKQKIRQACKASLSDPNVVCVKGPSIGIEVGLTDDVSSPFFEDYQNGRNRFMASKPFIDSHPGVEGALPIFRDALRVFDNNYCLNGLYNPFIERSLSVAFEHRTRGQYGGDCFRNNEILNVSLFRCVKDYLTAQKDSLESRLMKIADSIKTKNGNLCGFRIELPDVNDSKLKASGVFNEIESLVKQYYILQKYGTLNEELFRDTQYPGFDSLGSKQQRKYLEVVDNDTTKSLMKAMFQRRPSFPKMKENIYHPFSIKNAIEQHRFAYDDYSSYDRTLIDQLIESELVVLDENGYLISRDRIEMDAFEDLYQKLFMPYGLLRNEQLPSIESLVRKGIAIWTNGLFAKQELNFIDYYMTDKRPCAASLRNKYQHGASFVNSDEAEMDYCAGLRILSGLVYKIKEEVEKWE